MNAPNPYPQEKLNEIWDLFGTENPYPGATKVVDDIEQVMTILDTNSQLSFSRKPGGVWQETIEKGEDKEFE